MAELRSALTAAFAALLGLSSCLIPKTGFAEDQGLFGRAIECQAPANKMVEAVTYGDLYKGRWAKPDDAVGEIVWPTIAAVPPEPPRVRNRVLKGSVLVAVLLDEKGEAVSTDVVCSSDVRLDKFALAAARASTYGPETRGGRPVVSVVTVPYVFP